MKQLFLIAFAWVLSFSCFAQWSTSGSNIYFKTGIVSIGTQLPSNTQLGTNGFKLAVAGGVIAEEVVIKIQSAWPDYVFEPGHEKLTLTELENFIVLHRHLPEIPSSAEVADNGINVEEMNVVLLKKIEELTLYVIELKKETNALSAEIEMLKK
jgi:hypothetical protein